MNSPTYLCAGAYIWKNLVAFFTFNSFMSINMLLPSAGKSQAIVPGKWKGKRLEFWRCYNIAWMLYYIAAEIQRTKRHNKDNKSPLPTVQSTIHCPAIALFFPCFCGLLKGKRPGSGRKHLNRVISTRSFSYTSHTEHSWDFSERFSV